VRIAVVPLAAKAKRGKKVAKPAGVTAANEAEMGDQQHY
jgi:hypothetical protein